MKTWMYFMKRIISVVAAICFVSGFTADKAEAKNNFFDQLEKIITSIDITSSKPKVSKNSIKRGYMLKREEMPMDGSYVQLAATEVDYSTLVAEYYFSLEKPAVVDLHAIGHGKFPVEISIYDRDNIRMDDSIWMSQGTAKDIIVVLSPGKYTIKCESGAISQDGGIDFEMKMSKEDIFTNVSDVAYKRLDAQLLMANAPTYDYIPYHRENQKKYRYYGFDMSYDGEITIATEKTTDNCDMKFDLLDADENVITSWYGIYDVHEEKRINLKPGRYYIRVKQYYNAGGAYCLTIK